MKRVLVTGGAAGLGAAIVDRFLGEGWHVVCVDIEEAPPRENLVQMRCDLADRQELDRLLPVLVGSGPFRAAFLNAGISATGRFEEIPVSAYRRVMTLNAETPMVMAAALVKADALRGGGLCFVSSLSHFTGYPGASVYAASKDALAIYAKSVRRPFAARGVSVTLACPGPLATEHAERHAPAGADASRRMAPALAARRIVAATLAGKRLVVPGRGARIFALAGRLAPTAVTRQVSRLVHERLENETW